MYFTVGVYIMDGMGWDRKELWYEITRDIFRQALGVERKGMYGLRIDIIEKKACIE